MDSQWLKTQFALNPDKTKAALAKALGLNPAAISKILKGTRQIKAQEFATMCTYFGAADGKVKPRHGNSYVLTPLKSMQDLKEDAPHAALSEWIIPANILNTRTKAPSDQIKIFQVHETTMEPAFRHGEYVLVDLSDKRPSPPGVFVVSDGFGHLVRQCEYLPGKQPQEIKVSAKDKSFQPQILKSDEFKVVGRVIAKLQLL